MSDVSARYARLSQDFAETVTAVPAERWSSASPCEGWDARDLVRHVVDTQGVFLGLVGRKLGDIPSVDADPLAAWNAARAVVQADLDEPGRANTAALLGPGLRGEGVCGPELDAPEGADEQTRLLAFLGRRSW